MAWTAQETARVTAIESAMNKLLTMVNNLASKEQIRQLLLIRQDEIVALQAAVAQLESQVTTLQQAL